MSPTEARALYPHLHNGFTYLNHAAVSPLSKPVADAVTSFIRERSEGEVDAFPMVLAAMAEAKTRLGSLINAHQSRIAFTDNTTNGINLLASGVQWKHGDRVLLNSLEFPANVYPFLNLQRLGVSVDFVPATGGKVTAEAVISAITPATRLVSISSVQFLTGYRAALKPIGEYCRARGIIFCVDAIQGLGAVPVDVADDCIDFLSSGTQKWLMGMMGTAFIFITEALQEQLRPAYAGWLSVENAWQLLDYKLQPLKSADAFWFGTAGGCGIIACNAALKVFESVGYAAVTAAVLTNTEYLMQGLRDAGVNTFLEGETREHLAGITSFRHTEATNIFKALESGGIRCSLREDVIRFSPHYYNTVSEAEAALSCLSAWLRSRNG